MRYFLILLAIPLAGCAQMAAQQEAEAAAQRARAAAIDDQTCRSYGALPGSDAYVACRINADNFRTQLVIAAAQQQQANSDAMLIAGASIMAAGQAAPPPPAPMPNILPPPPVRCRNSFGTVVCQ